MITLNRIFKDIENESGKILERKDFHCEHPQTEGFTLYSKWIILKTEREFCFIAAGLDKNKERDSVAINSETFKTIVNDRIFSLLTDNIYILCFSDSRIDEPSPGVLSKYSLYDDMARRIGYISNPYLHGSLLYLLLHLLKETTLSVKGPQLGYQIKRPIEFLEKAEWIKKENSMTDNVEVSYGERFSTFFNVKWTLVAHKENVYLIPERLKITTKPGEIVFMEVKYLTAITNIFDAILASEQLHILKIPNNGSQPHLYAFYEGQKVDNHPYIYARLYKDVFLEIFKHIPSPLNPYALDFLD